MGSVSQRARVPSRTASKNEVEKAFKALAKSLGSYIKDDFQTQAKFRHDNIEENPQWVPWLAALYKWGDVRGRRLVRMDRPQRTDYSQVTRGGEACCVVRGALLCGRDVAAARDGSAAR